MKTFWDNFYKKPLDEIPWQRTQADWFTELVDAGEFAGGAILDIGCGTGKKSIYLADHGCNHVFGVDISEQAIEYAKQNALDSDVSDKCQFAAHDVTQWNFFKEDEMFDCILDWAVIHTIPREHQAAYAKNIEAHCNTGGKYLVRAFASHDGSEYFVENNDGMETKIFFSTEESLKKLFPQFRVLKKNISQPRTKKDYSFIELLFEKE